MGVGLDAASTKSRVEEKDGGHTPNGSKTRTINGFDVDATAAHVKINLETGVKGTMVPTAEKGTEGPGMV